MPTRKDGRGISARPVVEDLWGGWKAQALLAAIDLDVFRLLAAGKRSVGEIAAAARATPRGIRALLDALVGMRYLGRRGDRYNLRPLAENFLVRGRPAYLGSLALLTRSNWQEWTRLGEVIRTGRLPARSRSSRVQDVSCRLAETFFDLNYRTACWAAESIPARRLRGVGRILDVSAGAGAWSIALAQALPEARVTVLDRPEGLRMARREALRLGVAKQYRFERAEFQTAELGVEAYDLVLLGHVLHTLGPAEARELVRKSAAALRPRGALLAAGFLTNDVRTGPLLPLLFGLFLLLETPQGDAYTFRDYRTWMRAAGLHGVRQVVSGGVSPLIFARK